MAEKREGHKWFAFLYDPLIASGERGYMRRVREEIMGGARGRVLELGAGTGLSFSYYNNHAERIIATEPDAHMLQRARRRLKDAARPIELQQAWAEEMPFQDASFDTVVSTLVMCTTRDLLRALSEVRRVLKPSGELRMYEHVRYDHAFGAFWQDLVTPAWRWFGAGCHPNRDIAGLVREAGFEFQRLEFTKPDPPIPPWVFSRPRIMGVARPA
jgi:ubiquinone/menaquinone biosynthesis C-methylase UbiE